MNIGELERYKKFPKGEKPKPNIIVLPPDEEDEVLNIYGFGPAGVAAWRAHHEAEKKIDAAETEKEKAETKKDEGDDEYEEEEDVEEVKQDLWEALNLLTYAVDDLKRVIDRHDAAGFEVLSINMVGEIVQTIAESKKFLDKWPDADVLVTIQE